MDRFVSAYNKGKLCQEFLPVPEGYYDDERWYNWCVNTWGTKWDVGADEGTEKEERYGLKATVVGEEASCSFDSAWAPPIGLYRELVLQGYRVAASYFEPGLCFCGVWIDDYDNYIEYKSKDEIPVGIWNDFGLDEFFADDEAVEA
jgi:hypothetical protein